MRHKKTASRHQPAASGVQSGATIRIFGWNFIIVTMMNFLVMTTYYLQFVTGASYAMKVYGLALNDAGLSAGIIVIGCLLGRFASGNFVSSFGCRKMLFLGFVAYTLSIAAFFLVSSWQGLFMQRLVLGISAGISATATGTMVACIVPHEHHGLGIGIFSISTVLALALGPFLGISLMQSFSYSEQIGFAAFLAGICIPGSLILKSFPEPCKWKRPIFRLNSYIDSRVAIFAMSALLFCPSYGCVQVFMPGFAAERGIGSSAGIFFICYAFAALATRPFTGRLYDRFGASLIMPPLFIISICALCILAVASYPVELILSGILFGIGFGNYQSIGQSVAVSSVTRSRFAQATTTFFIFFDLGVGLGPYIFGFIVELAGYFGMFLSLAATAFAGMVFLMFIERRRAH